jgi:hypothetical protein
MAFVDLLVFVATVQMPFVGFVAICCRACTTDYQQNKLKSIFICCAIPGREGRPAAASLLYIEFYAR